jgi:hypothetical protein
MTFRLKKASRRLQAKIPLLEKALDRAVAEYMACKDASQLGKLERLISNLDTRCVIDRNAAPVLASIVYGHFRLGLDSVAIALQLKISPACVRQTLKRVWKTAVSLGFDPPTKIRYWRNARENSGEQAAHRRELNDRRRAQRAAHRAKAELEEAARQAAKAAATPILKKRSVSSGEPTRQRWRREGRCPACGGERETPTLKTCAACREISRRRNAPRLAREKAARALRPADKELWKVRLSESQKAAHARKRELHHHPMPSIHPIGQ